MVNYQDGKIYKITCDEEPKKVYIGSTCEPILSRRLAGHRSDYKSYLAGKRRAYVRSFDIVKYPSAIITLIESVPCDTKDELLKKERYWIQQSDGIVNKRIEGRSYKEWVEANKDSVKIRTRRFHEANKNKAKLHYQLVRKPNAQDKKIKEGWK